LQENFSHIRFCRPNARWLSLLDDFVTTNFGTRAPRSRARLEQNSDDATDIFSYKNCLWTQKNALLQALDGSIAYAA